MSYHKAIVIGTSTGGMTALSTIFHTLPENFPIPIIVAQHLHPSQGEDFFKYFDDHCRLIVKSADEKEFVQPGYVYFAPPNYHLLIEKNTIFSLSVDEKIRYSRPSIDVLFESAADVYASSLIGIILTGANDDGTLGLKATKKNGGLCIVQDPTTAEADYMPRSALAAVDVDHVLPLEEIGPFLVNLIMTNIQ